MNHKVAFFKLYLCIAGVWSAGMVMGAALVCPNDIPIISNDLGHYFMSTSFPGIFLSSVFPIFTVIVFWRLGNRFLIYAALLVHGFVFGYCSVYLLYFIDISLFCVVCLWMFSQCCNSTLLLFLCPALLSNLDGRVEPVYFVAVPVSLLICFFDYFVIFNSLKI